MRSLFVASLIVVAAACGNKSKSDTADAPYIDATPLPARCGNHKVEPPEECDEGETTTLLCDATCHLTCGNGAVDTSVGEVCDTGIATGAGACPATCDDGMSCTTDVLSGSACTAACLHTTITDVHDGDGCCPAGANHNTDSDCSATCGNGVVESGETCDTAITTGTGKCPTSCTDGMACTKDVLSSGGTCQAACTFPAITNPANGDGCCPAGANANNDNDCSPMCGNKVVETGEQCDDGNSDPNDGCTACKITALPPTAFRMSDLDLRDPHTFVALIGCNDITDPNFLGTSVNGLIQTAITTDGDMPADGLLDFSPTVVFRPLDQSKATNAAEIYLAACTAPLAGTSCKKGTQAATPITVTNMSGGQCLAALAGTTQPYTPAITNTSAPCFVSNAVTLNIVLAGIPITLHDTKIAATYVGNPAGSVTNGLLMGFITEAEADATVIPANLPVVGGKPLSSLLTGGKTLSDMMNACHNNKSDKDVNNGVAGWWFYLNFPASKVPWSDN